MREQSTGPSLETTRLRLIPLCSGDAHDQLLRDVASGSAIYWSVRLFCDDRLAGLCDLSDIRPSRSTDIGLILARPFWGPGFAYEACNGILGEAQQRGSQSVTARIHGGNERSACASPFTSNQGEHDRAKKDRY